MSVWDVWDDLFDPSDEDIKKAYAEGVRDRDNADIIDQTLHGIGDDFPLGGRKEQARDAGWHDRDEGKVNWVRIDPTTPSTHSANSCSTQFRQFRAHSVCRGTAESTQ